MGPCVSPDFDQVAKRVAWGENHVQCSFPVYMPLQPVYRTFKKVQQLIGYLTLIILSSIAQRYIEIIYSLLRLSNVRRYEPY